jgi:hypothetical protein
MKLYSVQTEINAVWKTPYYSQNCDQCTNNRGGLFPCGGGIEYLHRSPASRKRRRKGNPVPGDLGNPVPGGYKYGDLALQVGGSLNNWDNKIWYWVPLDSDSSGTALARTSSNNKLQTRPLVREGGTKYQTRNCLKKISRRKKSWSRVPGGCLTPRLSAVI